MLIPPPEKFILIKFRAVMTAASPPFLENPLYINRVIEIQQSWYNENNCLQQQCDY